MALLNSFPSGSFRPTEILKLLQKSGTEFLYAGQESLIDIIKVTKEPWPGGKAIVGSLTADPGGGSFGGLMFQGPGSTFMSGDRAAGTTYSINPKMNTFTIQTDNVTDEFTKSDAAAYINHLKLEWDCKMELQKWYNSVQEATDGTGRVGTPVGFGPSDTAAGASFTLPDVNTPLRIKLSSLPGVAGSVAHFFEGMFISFIIPAYDPGNTGASTADNTNCDVRYLVLEFVAGSTKSYFDAFRVINVIQEENVIEVMPGRLGAPSGASYVPTANLIKTSAANVQQQNSGNMWCAGSGTVTVKPYHGMTTDLSIATTLTAIPNFNAIFAPEVAYSSAACQTGVAIICPGYMPTTDISFGTLSGDNTTMGTATVAHAAAARKILGFGWTASMDLGYLNPHWMTGIHGLMVASESCTLHGINRATYPQTRPTKYDHRGQQLDFNTFYRIITNHYNRNKGTMPEWSAFLLNPIVYSAMITLSELDRRIIEGTGFRGETEMAQYIKIGNKKFQLEQHSAMRHDAIYLLPQGAITMYGGKVEQVKVGGDGNYLSLVNGARTNQTESYFTIIGERAWAKSPRPSAYLVGFQPPVV